jgi:hypothetical protein
MIYLDNDPTKPVIYIGIIFYTFCVKINRIKYLLIENNNSKYEDIGINLGESDNINETNINETNINETNINETNINETIASAIKFHTNYLIDLTEKEIERIVNLKDSKQVYIPYDMSLIKFVKAPPEISNLKSKDFGIYTVKSNDEKIRRYIKWIDKTYLFRFLYRSKKISKKLNNKEVIDTFKSINSENNLNLVLSNIHKKIKSSSN